VLTQAGVALTSVEGIGVSIGPGTFSGLPIGLSTAKGLCYGLGQQLVGVSTLEALAATVSDWEGRVCTLLDARRKEVYAAFFWCERNGQPQRLTHDMVMIPDELLKRQGEHVSNTQRPCLFIGDGAEVYHDLIRDIYRERGEQVQFLPWATHHPSGGAVARLAWQRLQTGDTDEMQSLVPRYIRVSDAERKRRRVD
jgi:tRNA threonylcarbamoyladenosine biosynthesis protein TsaB